MKISKITLRCLKVPLVHPYALSKAYGVQLSTDIVVAEVCTDEGIVGWGECDPWAAFTGDTLESVTAVIRYCIAPALIGKDPLNINAIHALMDSLIRGNNIAKSAIDMACYDILGKAYGMPVNQLIGGKLRDTIRCFWAVGGSTPQETASDILEIKNKGYWGCMIKIGTDYKNDIARTLAAREAVGSDFPLIADANQGWDTETAIAYGNGVASANLLFFEQPVKHYDVAGLAKIRSKISTPVSADEGISTIQDAMALIKANACDVFSIKTTKHGGIAPTKQICDFAASYGIKLFFNSMLEEGITQAASLNIASTVTNLLPSTGHSFFSTKRLQGDVTDFCDWTVDGITTVPNKPGLGIEINQTNLDKYTVFTCAVE